ncbi:MAG: DUF2497 domain-containing protein, partial [Methylocystis sp.]|nr:DUF2497 domain-containing protein [Methylocystis sp.]
PPQFAAREAREAPRSWVEDADDALADRRDEAEPGEAAPSEIGGRDGGEEAAASLAAAHETGASLVSADAAASVASHFEALAASMALSESDLIARYAQDMLRPLLKQWLDDNLPVLVERLVRAEIERVARGRR